jgi:hypothetical protein
MKPENCLVEENRPAEYAEFRIKKPANKNYRFSSDNPITISLAFHKGTILVEKYPITSTESISHSQTVTELLFMHLWGEDVSIIPTKNTSFDLFTIICDSDFRISDSYVRKTYYSNSENSGTNIFTTYDFKIPDQEVSLTINNASDQDGSYDTVQITYRSDEYGWFSIETQGKNVDFQIPDGESESDKSGLILQFVKSQDIQFIDPLGHINIEPEGKIPFQSSGDENSDLILQNNEKDRVYMLSGGRDRLVLSGLANSIKYNGNELLHSRWQLFSPELQAAIVAAGLGALGFLIARFSPKLYRKYVSFIRSGFYQKNKFENSDTKISVPIGYTIFKLSDGCMIAGKLIKKPDIFRKIFVLSDILLLENNEEWKRGPKDLVIHEQRIIYHFVKLESIE